MNNTDLNTVDLNLDNYGLTELLNLFKLNYDFTTEDLKKVKKIVLLTHPDKSKLDKDYFLFFSSAYKVVLSIHEFRTRTNNQKNTKYTINRDKEKELLLRDITILETLSKKSNFNKLFNELFEEHKLKDEYKDNGYGQWLKSSDNISDIDDVKLNLNEMNDVFERKKQELKAIIIKKEIEDTETSNYYDLTCNKPENYSSSIFSSLQFEDLQKAHNESIIPVSNDDYEQRKKYKNMFELQKERCSENTMPLSEQQSKEFFNKKSRLDLYSDTKRAFKLAQQDEAAKKANLGWMSRFKQLQL